MKKKTKIVVCLIVMLVIVLGIFIFLQVNKNNENNLEPEMNNVAEVETSAVVNINEQEVLADKTYGSEKSNESVIVVSNNGVLTAANLSINKLKGDTTNVENSEFYGLNAAVLSKKNSQITISDSRVTTEAEGANAIFANGENSNIYVSNVKINTTKNSSRGLDSTYGGKIVADNVTISTSGSHCSTLATDRGKGTVSVSDSILNTNGEGSPIIYSTGEINVKNITGTANKSCIAIVEGKNSALIETSNISATANGRAEDGKDDAGIMLYQSMSGDASEGVGIITINDSNLTILENSSVYKTAPMFFVTNTNAKINVQNTTLSYGSGKLLSVLGNDGEWGEKGANGGEVVFNATNQKLEGNIEVDNISKLNLNLISSNYEGTINSEKTAKELNLTIDAKSTINLTGDWYLSVLKTEDSSLKNINSNGNTIYYDSTKTENSWINGEIYLLDGGSIKPIQN